MPGTGESTRFERFASGVDLGHAALGDLDSDGAADVFALTSSGVSFTRGPARADAHDLRLPEGLAGRDVAVLTMAGESRRAAVLLERSGEPGQLILGLLPALPWPATTETALREAPTREDAVVPEIPLE